MGVVGNARPRTLGRVAYGESAPHRLGVTLSRVREAQGQGGRGRRISNRGRRAQALATEDAHRCGCAHGVRAAQWEVGVAPARVPQLTAWARLVTRFALALLVVVSWGINLLVRRGPRAVARLRRVASRRRGRWEVSVVSARVGLLQTDKSLFAHLSPRLKLDLEASLANVS